VEKRTTELCKTETGPGPGPGRDPAGRAAGAGPGAGPVFLLESVPAGAVAGDPPPVRRSSGGRSAVDPGAVPEPVPEPVLEPVPEPVRKNDGGRAWFLGISTTILVKLHDVNSIFSYNLTSCNML
jgi:hypothetical protein